MFQLPPTRMEHKIKVILFDIDGTLISTGGAGKRAFGQACAEVYDIGQAGESIKLAGRTDLGIAKELLEAYQLQPDPDTIQQTFEGYLRHLTNNLQDGKTRILPGIPELIAGLQALPDPPVIALLTGNLARGAEIKLRHVNLWQHFAWGIYGDAHDERNALAHDALAMAREKVAPNIEPSELLVIGDTVRDIECARAVGARVLAVTTGEATKEELAQREPNLLVDNLTQVTAEEVVII